LQTLTAKDGGTTSPSLLLKLEPMMDQKLISLYQSTKDNYFLTTAGGAGDHATKTTTAAAETEVCLQTVVVREELVSLYSIPYISRSNIKNDRPLLEFYRTMLEKPSMNRAPDLNKLRQEHLEMGIMESTVIAQVMVWCNEIFYVKDVATGAILQGHYHHQDPTHNGDDNDDDDNNNGGDDNSPARPRLVQHLVRMEMTVKTDKTASGSFRNVQENWIITDIDDLLDGNLIV
jgi:hypothetical protein